MNLVGDLVYLVAAMVQVSPQQHNQQICGKLTGLFHPHQVLLLSALLFHICIKLRASVMQFSSCSTEEMHLTQFCCCLHLSKFYSCLHLTQF